MNDDGWENKEDGLRKGRKYIEHLKKDEAWTRERERERERKEQVRMRNVRARLYKERLEK